MDEKIKVLEESEKINQIDSSIVLEKKFCLTNNLVHPPNIINKMANVLPEDTQIYLRDFKKKYDFNDIIKELGSLENLRVAVIGDAILDKYTKAKAMDKAGKEAIIPYELLDSEIYLGGVFAVARHLAEFIKEVTVITCLGDKEFTFINDRLNPKIKRNFFIKKDSKTITKERILDYYKGRKVFETYNNSELSLNIEEREKLKKYLDENKDKFDLIIIADFGHGLLTRNLAKYFFNYKKYLAINCQINAGNWGYNLITKYRRADFVSLNETEVRLPFQEKTRDIQIPIRKLRKYIKANQINITLGKSGSIYFDNGKFFKVPSFTQTPLDTVGAGDAILSLTSLLAYQKTNPELISFFASCVGAMAVNIMGNKESINKNELKEFINYILR